MVSLVMSLFFDAEYWSQRVSRSVACSDGYRRELTMTRSHWLAFDDAADMMGHNYVLRTGMAWCREKGVDFERHFGLWLVAMVEDQHAFRFAMDRVKRNHQSRMAANPAPDKRELDRLLCLTIDEYEAIRKEFVRDLDLVKLPKSA